jgi:glycosyltransferase involved in cell wall biosynthesis
VSAVSRLWLIANARLPSERAQSLQVLQTAAAFSRAGVDSTLVYARRRNAPKLPEGRTLYEHYQVPPGARPALRETPCVDWIDAFPVSLQYFPARVQELTFSRNAALALEREPHELVAYSREIECARQLLRRGRKRVFLEIHRVPGGETRRRWLREVLATCSGVVAISGGVRDDLLELGARADDVCVEHDGFDAARFAERPPRERTRDELGLARDALVVVYTGGLLAWKGAELIVEAARELPLLQFVIAGGMAADVEKLRERAAGVSNLRIDGFQAPERVALYLAAADLGLAPNRSQPAISSKYTSPLKVFEAMAVGLPLVASDLPSLREILTHDRDAWLVAPDDARALAEGIRRLAEDPALRERLSKSFGARASEHTWDARARRLVSWMGARV